MHLKLRLETLCMFFGPAAERKPGGHIADGAALHWVKPFHVRSFPTEFDIPIGRLGISEDDDLASNVLVKISFKVEGDLERLLVSAEVTHPAGDFARGCGCRVLRR
jgi:hypothetical protein